MIPSVATVQASVRTKVMPKA